MRQLVLNENAQKYKAELNLEMFIVLAKIHMHTKKGTLWQHIMYPQLKWKKKFAIALVYLFKLIHGDYYVNSRSYLRKYMLSNYPTQQNQGASWL